MRVSLVVALLCGLISSVGAAPKKPTAKPRLLVLVLDRSGSMQGPRLDAARTAAEAAVASLAATDIVAIVAFDSESFVVSRPQSAQNKQRIHDDLAKLTAGGGTNVFVGLKEARDILKDRKETKKHLILLSDGEAATDGIPEIVKEMHDAGATLSAVGIPDADRTLLQLIADGGAGRLYMVDDLGALSKVFVKETAEGLR